MRLRPPLALASRLVPRLAAAAALALTAATARGQGAPPGAPPSPNGPAARDTAFVEREANPTVAAARQGQRAFERTRRNGLRFYNGGAEAKCEERIGRLCYWNNNGDVPPPEERSEVITEREDLLVLLARAAAADPADDWTAGQRLRYLGEARRYEEAARAADACRGTLWWCTAIRGTAAHWLGRHARAAAAFDSALALMPAAERCAWRDVSLWLPLKDQGAYRALACDGGAIPAPAAAQAPADARGTWERRFWWLAQPLWILDGNDLRNELLTRRTITRIESQGGIPYDFPWGDDMAESELRYGTPSAWSITTGGAADPRPPSVIGHEPTPSYDFVPRAAALADPLTAPASAWVLKEPLARMRYAPRYATNGFDALPHHQLARFRRGDSLVVVGAWDVERDREWGSGAVTAGVGLATLGGPTFVRKADALPRRGAVRVTAPLGAYLASVEVLGPQQRRAGRAREAIEALAPGAQLSDLLLLRRGAGAAPTLDGVLPEVLGSTRIRAGGTMGLYWESYLPASPSAPATVALEALRLNTTRLERLRSALRVGSVVRPVAVRFQDVGRPDGQPGRTLTVSWPNVPTGDYRLELTVTPAGGGAPVKTGMIVRVESEG